MKIWLSQKHWLSVSILSIILFLSVNYCLWAEATVADVTTTQTSSDLNVVLTGPNHVLLGQPVLIHYKIVNPYQQDIHAMTGSSQSDWVKIELADNIGRIVFVSPNASHATDNPFLADGQMITAHSQAEGNINVSDCFKNAAPGSYSLRLYVSLPFNLREIAHIDTSSVLTQNNPIFVQDYSLNIKLTKTNAAILRSTAASLYEQIIEGKDSDAAIEGLFSLPEASAMQVWQRLVTEPSLNDHERLHIAAALGKLKSSNAADVLAAMRWHPAQQREDDSWPADGHELEKMYNSSDGVLKQHIKRIYSLHGITVGSQIPLPGNDN